MVGIVIWTILSSWHDFKYFSTAMVSWMPSRHLSQNFCRWCFLKPNWGPWKLENSLTNNSVWLIHPSATSMELFSVHWVSVVKVLIFAFACQLTLVSSVGWTICLEINNCIFKGSRLAFLFLTNRFMSSRCSITIWYINLFSTSTLNEFDNYAMAR